MTHINGRFFPLWSWHREHVLKDATVSNVRWFKSLWFRDTGALFQWLECNINTGPNVILTPPNRSKIHAFISGLDNYSVDWLDRCDFTSSQVRILRRAPEEELLRVSKRGRCNLLSRSKLYDLPINRSMVVRCLSRRSPRLSLSFLRGGKTKFKWKLISI
jgi:hypothetical protein